MAGTPPSSQGSPMVPAEGGPKIFKFKSSWSRRTEMLALSLKHLKGRMGGGVRGGGPPCVTFWYPPLLLRCTAVLTHHRKGVPPPSP